MINLQIFVLISQDEETGNNLHPILIAAFPELIGHNFSQPPQRQCHATNSNNSNSFSPQTRTTKASLWNICCEKSRKFKGK